MDKKNVVFLSVISVATLLTAVIGTTFAYFTANMASENKNESTQIVTATLGVTYTEASSVNISNISTENSALLTRTFTVKNESNSAITYNVLWKDVNNTFISDANLNYNLSVTTDGSDGTIISGLNKSGVILPSDDKTPIVSNVSIPAGAVHTYTIDFNLGNTSIDSSLIYDNVFSGSIYVSGVQSSN